MSFGRSSVASRTTFEVRYLSKSPSNQLTLEHKALAVDSGEETEEEQVEEVEVEPEVQESVFTYAEHDSLSYDVCTALAMSILSRQDRRRKKAPGPHD
jgi:hypothetical protein